MIQIGIYICIHVSGLRQTGLEENTSFTSPGTLVHVMHVLFVFFAVFDNLKASFSQDNMSVHTLDVFIENATKMV